MRPDDSTATVALTRSLVATLESTAATRPVLRRAVVAALARAFAPADLQALVAELAAEQRARCQSQSVVQLNAAAAGAETGDLVRAREAAEDAVKLDFTNPEAHRVLADILEQLGDRAAAHVEYVLARHLGWEGASAAAAVARTSPTRGAAEATSPEERRFQEALERAISCMESRDLEHARRHARAAVAMDPSRPEGFNLQGVLAELAGRWGEARAQYRIALELQPDYRPAAENLARSVREWTERGPPLW